MLIRRAPAGIALQSRHCVHASMKALVEGGYLRDPGEAVGVIDPQLINGIAGFLFEAGILRDAKGDPLAELPDVSDWYTNAYLAQ